MPAILFMGFLRFKNLSESVQIYVEDTVCSVYLFLIMYIIMRMGIPINPSSPRGYKNVI